MYRNLEEINICLSCEKLMCDNCLGTTTGKRRTLPVEQMDLEWNIIKLHPSIKDAAEAVGADSSAISRCCKGKVKTVKNYRWRYAGAH